MLSHIMSLVGNGRSMRVQLAAAAAAAAVCRVISWSRPLECICCDTERVRASVSPG